MAHFAELDHNNVVLRVIVINNDDMLDENGIENEDIGIIFCKSIFGNDTNWKQTSYNASFRKRYASIGSSYNSELDAFILPKPYDSWLLKEETCDWEAPVPYPNDNNSYDWDEEHQIWIQYVG